MIPNTFDLQALAAAGWEPLLWQGTTTFVAFTLVALRLTGMLSLAPVFGHPAIPWQPRLLLVLGLSLMLAPALVSAGGFENIAPIPATLLDYALLAGLEFALGAALGLGVATVLSGLWMAGALIDQQLGLSMSETFNPESGVKAALGGQLLHWLGMAVFLVVGGHLWMIDALMESFTALPIGMAEISPAIVDLLCELVQQSLLLALRVAAPVIATATVVGWGLGILARAIPQMQATLLALPARVLVGMLVLGLSLTGAAGFIAEALPKAIAALRGEMSPG